MDHGECVSVKQIRRVIASYLHDARHSLGLDNKTTSDEYVNRAVALAMFCNDATFQRLIRRRAMGQFGHPPPLMFVWCKWCDRPMPPFRKPCSPEMRGTVSHGICKNCEAKEVMA